MVSLPATTDIRTIICLLLGEIGDAVVCTPTLRALRRRYPHAKLTLIARPPIVELLAHSELVDDAMPFAAPDLWRKLGFLFRLRKRRCDLWVDLQAPTFNTFGTDRWIFRRNALLMRTAGSRYRLGFAVPELLPRLTHAIAVPDMATLSSENIVDTTLRLLPNEAHERAKSLTLAESDLAWVQAWWQRFPANAKVLGLFFGAKQAAKFWPEKNIREFVERWLSADPTHRVLLIGGPHEEAAGKTLLGSLSAEQAERVANAIGDAALGQSAALMTHCAALVCTDSGPMHIAEALGLPLVALMSHHNHQAIWRPLAKSATVLAHQVACGPCLRDVCDRDNECMALISAAEAMQAVTAALESRG